MEATKKRRVTTKRRPPTPAVSEQLAVTCTEADTAQDLKGLSGVLTIDYRDERPETVTFDPSDASIDNAIIPVYGFLRGDREIVIQSESARWRFSTTVLSLVE